jgi:predicted kinase
MSYVDVLKTRDHPSRPVARPTDNPSGNSGAGTQAMARGQHTAVTVVVLVAHGSAALHLTLASIAEQSLICGERPLVEVLVVDVSVSQVCRTDRTWAHYSSLLGGVRHLALPSTPPQAAKNLAVAHAHGQVIFLLSAGVILDRDALRSHLLCHEEATSLVVVGHCGADDPALPRLLGSEVYLAHAPEVDPATTAIPAYEDLFSAAVVSAGRTASVLCGGFSDRFKNHGPATRFWTAGLFCAGFQVAHRVSVVRQATRQVSGAVTSATGSGVIDGAADEAAYRGALLEAAPLPLPAPYCLAEVMEGTNRIRLRAPEMVLLVGLPASGKSTWSSLQQRPVVSSDRLRGLLAVSPTDPGANAVLFRALRAMARRHLVGGHSVVVDATNLERRYRHLWVNLAKRSNARIVCLWFDEPLGVVLRRNRLRSRVLSDSRIHHAAALFERPRPDEGFDVILRVRSDPFSGRYLLP